MHEERLAQSPHSAVPPATPAVPVAACHKCESNNEQSPDDPAQSQTISPESPQLFSDWQTWCRSAALKRSATTHRTPPPHDHLYIGRTPSPSHPSKPGPLPHDPSFLDPIPCGYRTPAPPQYNRAPARSSTSASQPFSTLRPRAQACPLSASPTADATSSWPRPSAPSHT